MTGLGRLAEALCGLIVVLSGVLHALRPFATLPVLLFLGFSKSFALMAVVLLPGAELGLGAWLTLRGGRWARRAGLSLLCVFAAVLVVLYFSPSAPACGCFGWLKLSREPRQEALLGVAIHDPQFPGISKGDISGGKSLVGGVTAEVGLGQNFRVLEGRVGEINFAGLVVRRGNERCFPAACQNVSAVEIAIGERRIAGDDPRIAQLVAEANPTHAFKPPVNHVGGFIHDDRAVGLDNGGNGSRNGHAITVGDEFPEALSADFQIGRGLDGSGRTHRAPGFDHERERC